jgi:hypothetical protein
LPLLALWSPLALMGLAPFAAVAGVTMLVRRRLVVRDFALPTLATAVALPALVYLQAASDSVGFRLYPIGASNWFYFQLFETIPLILGTALLLRGRSQALLLAVTAGWLALVPFIQVGPSVDFMMRASIPALAVLAVLVAEAITSRPSGLRPKGEAARLLLIGTLAIGALTAVHEISRALVYRPTPLTRCDLLGTAVEHPATGGVPAYSTYFAQVGALPWPLRPKRFAVVPTNSAAPCWERPWMTRR